MKIQKTNPVKRLFNNLYFAYSLVFILTFLGMLLGYRIGVMGIDDSLDESLFRELNYVNSQVPLMVDKDTRLDSVFLDTDRRQVVYRYSIVSTTKEEIEEADLVPEMRKLVRLSGCSDSQFFMVLNRGYEANLEYSDKNAKMVFVIKLTKDDCEDIQQKNSEGYQSGDQPEAEVGVGPVSTEQEEFEKELEESIKGE